MADTWDALVSVDLRPRQARDSNYIALTQPIARIRRVHRNWRMTLGPGGAYLSYPRSASVGAVLARVEFADAERRHRRWCAEQVPCFMRRAISLDISLSRCFADGR